MKLAYTYEGDRDPAFEDAMLGVLEGYGRARASAAVRTANGANAVTVEIDGEVPGDDIVRRLRTHERIIDVTEEGLGRRY